MRAHRFKRDRAVKAWANYIAAETAGRRPPSPLSKARVSIVRHNYRMLDFDGLVGSLKPVVDALVTCGIIADDSWPILGAWAIDQRFRPKALGSLLEIRVDEA